MNKFTVIIVVALLMLSFLSPVKAQIIFDSVLVSVDESSPSVNLISNDHDSLVGIKLFVIRLNNQSSHDITLNKTSFTCQGLHVGRLNMKNIYISKEGVPLGKIDAWSINNYSSLDFNFFSPVIIRSHSSIIIDLKSDLYGWGSYIFTLFKYNLMDPQTLETEEVICHLNSRNVILANTDQVSLKLGFFPGFRNYTWADTLYVLPGEFLYSAGEFKIDSVNYIEKAITAFRLDLQISQNLVNQNNYFFFQALTGNLGTQGHVTLDTNNVDKIIAWTANTSLNGINGLRFYWIFGRINLPIGDVAYIFLNSEAVFYNQFFSSPIFRYANHLRVFQSINGILGDFDGDNFVTQSDVDSMQQIYTNYNGFSDYYRYTKTGYNIGRASILFEEATLADILLLRIWLNNPQDPLVRDLGIGQLMSRRVGPTTAAYSQVICGNTLSINTDGFAVRISTILPSGLLWSNSALVSNGQVSFIVPDQSLQYRIEAIKLAGSMTNVSGKINLPLEFRLDQNYPNPFNPTTMISYSIPATEFVVLKVYDVLGQEVVTLVNEEKTPGNYQINFSGSNLASGTYICRLSAGSFHQIKKMILIK